jgi:hypothetical protein
MASWRSKLKLILAVVQLHGGLPVLRVLMAQRGIGLHRDVSRWLAEDRKDRVQLFQPHPIKVVQDELKRAELPKYLSMLYHCDFLCVQRF